MRMSRNDTHPNMAEIARAVGVSQSTVSRALHGTGRISQQTREHIRSVAANLGYRPDAGAAHLVARRWKKRPAGANLAVLFHRRSHWDNYSGLERPRIEQAGFAVDEFPLEDFRSVKQATSLMTARGISGILVFPRENSENEVWPALARDFPLVVSNQRTSSPLAPTFVPEAFHRVLDAVLKLESLGYRRITLVMPLRETSELTSHLRAATLLSQERLRPEISLDIIEYDRQRLPEHWQEQLRRQGAQVVLDFENVARQALDQLKVRIPEDIAYASLRATEPATCGMKNNNPEVVAAALQFLDLMMKTRTPGSHYSWLLQEIYCQWQTGATCPKSYSA